MAWILKGQVSVVRVEGEEVEGEAGEVLEAEGIGTETVGGVGRSLFSVGTTMLRSRSVRDGDQILMYYSYIMTFLNDEIP